MRVFITGGTGFIGSAVVPELAAAGHEVTALARAPDREERLRRLGATPAPGDLTNPAVWEGTAGAHEAILHCAFDYGGEGSATDAAAVEALLRAAAGGGIARVTVYTSGCWVLGDTGGELADEAASTDHPAEVVAWRPAVERRVLGAGKDGVGTAVIRPGMVYGGHGGLTRKLFESAEEQGAAAYVGTGENHWSMVHRRDLARLYRMVVEGAATGIFHGVDGHPVTVGTAARAASEAAGAGGAIRPLPLERARQGLGPVADALCLDQRLATNRSAELGWRPERASFPDAAEEAYRELKAWRR